MIPGWVDTIYEEVQASMGARGRFSARDLAEALGVSEAGAVSYITLLVEAGRLRIEAVSLPPVAGVGSLPAAPIRRAA